VPRFAVSKVFPAPPAEVFAFFTDLDRLPARVKDITRIEWLTDGPVGVGTKYKESRVVFKKEATETFEVTAYEPPARFETLAHFKSCGAEFRSDHRFTPDGAGTRVDLVVTTRAETWFGRLFTPLAHLMKPMFKRSLVADLDQMVAALAGKAPTPS
jgi:ligand-binding SRPBCC domain-containing protein